MPVRKTVFATGEIYHVFNRGVNHQPTFFDKHDYQRILEVLFFYQFVKLPIRFSFYNRLPLRDRERLIQEIQQKYQKLASILSFCLMPNHFHLLLKQTSENGISKLLANLQNSFTRYINIRHNRSGHLFQGQFKAVRIETEEQLVHVSRYIHLNPYTSYVVKTFDELKNYPWSSLTEYIMSKGEHLCETKTILSLFSSKKNYLKFIMDQRDYQRELKQIKHLLVE